MSLNTIRKVTELTGITVNALRYYDNKLDTENIITHFIGAIALMLSPFINNNLWNILKEKIG